MKENQLYRKGQVWGLGCDSCFVIFPKWHNLDEPFDCPDCGKCIFTPLSEEEKNKIEMALYAFLNPPNKACTGRKASCRSVKSKSVVALRQ